MSEKETPEVKDRRSLLKGLVAGSALITGTKALPDQWAKPLTNAVILPSHAQTTGDYTAGDYGGYNRGGNNYNYDDYSYYDRGGTDDFYNDGDYTGGDALNSPPGDYGDGYP